MLIESALAGMKENQMLNSWIVIGTCIGLGIATITSFIWPASASNGKKSWTLNFLRLTTLFIFATVIIDTVNDRYYPLPKPPATATTTTVMAPPKRGRRTRSSSKSLPIVRAVLKEKYNILGALWLGFAILYVLSHRHDEWSDTIIRGIMAVRKMDPFAGRDEIDKFIIQRLEDNFDSIYHHEWFLRALLAKKGIADAADASKTLMQFPASEDFNIDDPELPPGMAPPGTDEEDIH